MPHLIEPSFPIETGGLDHQSVSFPFGYRISEPLWIGLLGQLPAIHEYLPKLIERLIQDHHDVWLLENLERKRRRIYFRHALRQAVRIGVLRGKCPVLSL